MAKIIPSGRLELEVMGRVLREIETLALLAGSFRTDTASTTRSTGQSSGRCSNSRTTARSISSWSTAFAPRGCAD